MHIYKMGNNQINTFPKPIRKAPSLANIIAQIRRGENIDHLIVAAKERQMKMNELLNSILEKNRMNRFQFCVKPLEEDINVLINLYNEPYLLDIARSVTWTFIHINSNLRTHTDKDINFFTLLVFVRSKFKISERLSLNFFFNFL